MMSIITDHQSNVQLVKDFVSNFVSAFCGNMFSIAMGLMLLHETGLSISFGLSMIIVPLVDILGLIPIGNLVDRYRHKPILIINFCVRIGALIGYMLIINQFNGTDRLMPTLIFLIINYTTVSINNSGYQASVHELVNEAHIQKLNALSQSATSMAIIFSPLIAAPLYVILGFKTFLKFELIANLFALIVLGTMRFNEKKALATNENRKRPMVLFKEGLSFLMTRKELSAFAIGGMVINVTAPLINIGIPFMVVHHLHADNLTLGIFESAIAVGLVIGNFVLTLVPTIKRIDWTTIGGLSAFSMATIIVGVIFNLHWDLSRLRIVGSVILILIGISLAILNTPMATYIQKTVPTKLLGRVSMTLTTLDMAVMPLGTVGYTVVFQQFANGLIYVFSGSLLMIYTGYFWRQLAAVFPAKKQLDQVNQVKAKS